MKKIMLITTMIMFSLVVKSTSVSMDTIPTGTDIYICGSSLEVKTTISTSSIVWKVKYYDVNSVLIKTETTNDSSHVHINWLTKGLIEVALHSDQESKDFYLHMETGNGPYKSLPRDSNVCKLTGIILDAKNTESSATYLWNIGSEKKTITVSGHGTYWVKIKDVCATRYDTITLHYQNNNLPNIGSNRSICGGDTVTLDPGNHTLWNTYKWNNGTSLSSLNVMRSGTYWLETTDTNGCVARDTIILNFTIPNTQNACAFVFDSITTKNKGLWWSDPSSNGKYVVILKRNLSNVMERVDTVNYSVGSWIDFLSNPQNQQYEYQILIIDSCGNESTESPSHKTIRLSIGQFGSTLYFTWTAYEGVDNIPNYTLYGMKISGSVTTIAILPTATLGYTYKNFSTAFYKYYVGFNIPACSHRSEVEIRSNDVEATVGIQKFDPEDFIKIYQNDRIVISGFTGSITISNILGQQVFDSPSKQDVTIDISGFQRGMYVISLENESGNGFYKFIKQ